MMERWKGGTAKWRNDGTRAEWRKNPKRWNRGTVEAGNPHSQDDSLGGMNLKAAMMERGKGEMEE